MSRLHILAEAIKRFAPEELHVGAVRRPGEPRRHGRAGDLEIFAFESDVFVRPEPADQPHKLLRAGISLHLIAFLVAISGKLVWPGTT
jgi:hypothetical protein